MGSIIRTVHLRRSRRPGPSTGRHPLGFEFVRSGLLTTGACSRGLVVRPDCSWPGAGETAFFAGRQQSYPVLRPNLASLGPNRLPHGRLGELRHIGTGVGLYGQATIRWPEQVLA